MALDLGTCLRFYKRKDIQAAMVEHAQNKEFSVRYGEAFGRRPDILTYPKEIVELALKGVTSFHCSEELWENPLDLGGNQTKKDLDLLRIGWDLVLDIDCPDWDFSKLMAHLLIKSLKDNNVKDVTCKYSGNKGFHVGVPFEAFPREIAGKETRTLFPEGARKIAQYLLNFITTNYIIIKDNQIIIDQNYFFSLDEVRNKFGDKKYILNKCKNCKKEIVFKDNKKTSLFCSYCDLHIESLKSAISCPKCGKTLVKEDINQSLCLCGSNEYFSEFDLFTIIEVDTVLIAPRHLYRMPYSLHEKSGLVSLPIDPDRVLEFDRSMAHPDKILAPMFTFMDRNITGESAARLLTQALDFQAASSALELEKKEAKKESEHRKEIEEVQITCPIREDFFPPCMKLLLNGIEDGKKRAIFCMSGFLGKIGWGAKEIEEFLLNWNKEKNKIQLRDNYITSQLRYYKPGEKLPPNCSSEAYYKGIGVCKPDSLCAHIKNPVNYTLLRWKDHLRNREVEEKELAKEEKRKVNEIKKLERDLRRAEKEKKKGESKEEKTEEGSAKSQ